MFSFSALELDQAPQSACLNAAAPLNISDMSLTAETSQFLIRPYRPSGQSPTGDMVIHSITAAFNSAFVSSLNSVVEGMVTVRVKVRGSVRFTVSTRVRIGGLAEVFEFMCVCSVY